MAGRPTPRDDPCSRCACARPIEGEANDALIRLLAKSLGVPKLSISVGRGGQSRSKMIVVQGLDDEELRSRLVDGLSGD
jgi:uncharacterized protein YggU (UPF0235/DUF167 family)